MPPPLGREPEGFGDLRLDRLGGVGRDFLGKGAERLGLGGENLGLPARVLALQRDEFSDCLDIDRGLGEVEAGVDIGAPGVNRFAIEINDAL